MGIESILSGITNITDGGRNTAAEFREVLTDMTETLSGETLDQITTRGNITANDVTVGPLSASTISVNGGEIMDRIPNSADFQLFGNQSSTGVIYHEGLSGYPLDPTDTFHIGIVKGWIIDNTTDPSNPIIKYIDFSGTTGSVPSGITLRYIGTQPATYIGLSGNTINDIIQSPTKFGLLQMLNELSKL